MKRLTVEIEDEVYELLKARVEAAGRTVEEEAQRLFPRPVRVPAQGLGDAALRCFGSEDVELELPQHEPHEPIDLSDVAGGH